MVVVKGRRETTRVLRPSACESEIVAQCNTKEGQPGGTSQPARAEWYPGLVEAVQCEQVPSIAGDA